MFVIEFGLVDSNTKIKLSDVSSLESVYRVDPWPSRWTVYENRFSWTGDLADKINLTTQA